MASPALRTLPSPVSAAFIVLLVLAGASCGGESSGLQPVRVERITLTPAASTVAVDSTVALQAQAFDAAGAEVQVPLAWSQARSAVTSLNGDGRSAVVRGRGVGEDTVTVTAGGVRATAVVAVRAPGVARLLIGPDVAGLSAIGRTVQLAASFRTQYDDPVVAPAALTWSSLDAEVATVDGQGSVTAKHNGVARVIASAGSLRDTATVTVRQIAKSMQGVVPRSVVLEAGDTLQLKVIGVDSNDVALEPGAALVWSSTNASAVQVDTAGLLRAVAAGSTLIRAAPASIPYAGTTMNAIVAPGAPGTLAFSTISAGAAHACGIAAERLYCWGNNSVNQLGLGAAATGRLFHVPTLVADTLRFRSVSAGDNLTCAVATDGRGFCWGRNWTGQLGNGLGGIEAGGTPPSPVAVAGAHRFAMISASAMDGPASTTHGFACGLRTDGAVLCWGANYRSQLGRVATAECSASGSYACDPTPAPVAGGRTYTTVSAGSFHACAIATDGQAYCWGLATYGEIGDGSSGAGNSAAEPTAVAGGLRFAAIGAGDEFTCGVSDDGALYCWGRINGALTPALMPGATNLVSLDAGDNHVCAIDAAGAAWCWGLRTTSPTFVAPVLGDDPPLTLNPAVRPRRLPAVLSVSAGGGLTCATTRAGQGYCWGTNSDGQLGVGATTPTAVSYIPVRIRDPQ